MKDDFARLGVLIDRIYQSGLEPELWPAVLKEIADWIGAPKASLFSLTLPYAQGGFTYDHDLSPELDEVWRTQYQPDDIYTNRVMQKGLGFQGNVILDRDVITEGDLLGSAYYNEFLKIDDISRLLTGMVFDANQHDAPVTACCLYRGRKHKEFTEADRARYKLLLPHISRALGMQFRLRDADQRVAANLAALEALGTALMLVGAGDEIVFANRAVRKLLEDRDGLELHKLPGKERWRLLSKHNATQAKIDAALRRAVDRDNWTSPHFSKALAVRRPSGLADYVLQLSTLPQHNDFGAAGGGDVPRAVLFVADTAGPLALDGAMLTHLFGLTAREAQLAVVLGEGMDLTAAACVLHIMRDTAKTQLKAIYAKTGVNSRQSLMKLLMALAAGRV